MAMLSVGLPLTSVRGAQCAAHTALLRCSPNCRLQQKQPCAGTPARQSTKAPRKGRRVQQSMHASDKVSPENLPAGTTTMKPSSARSSSASKDDEPESEALTSLAPDGGQDDDGIAGEQAALSQQEIRNANIKAMLTDTVEVERQAVLPRFLKVACPQLAPCMLMASD